jgi:hypothetical protein
MRVTAYARWGKLGCLGAARGRQCVKLQRSAGMRVRDAGALLLFGCGHSMQASRRREQGRVKQRKHRISHKPFKMHIEERAPGDAVRSETRASAQKTQKPVGTNALPLRQSWRPHACLHRPRGAPGGSHGWAAGRISIPGHALSKPLTQCRTQPMSPKTGQNRG